MGGIVLGIIVIAGLIGVACWERRGGRVPDLPDLPEMQLPAHGVNALVVGLLLAVIAASIVAIDLSLIWLKTQ
ncbi:MAG TPA: hypothetical protein VKH36_16390 [Acidimicrobiia bacterium]|nr:hypothetical protein [Acidimicrobiia bacterium]